MKKTIQKCSNSSRYKGIRKPRCNKGNPCQTCLDKYRAERLTRTNPGPSQKDDPSGYYAWYCTIYGGP